MPIFFTISSFKTFRGCRSIQLQKLHLNSNDIVQLRLTDQYQLQKLHADFFHYIQFQNVRRVPVYPTTQTTLQFESHMKGLANWTWPTTETTGRFFSLYPVWKGSAYQTTETTSDFESRQNLLTNSKKSWSNLQKKSNNSRWFHKTLPFGIEINNLFDHLKKATLNIFLQNIMAYLL